MELIGLKSKKNGEWLRNKFVIGAQALTSYKFCFVLIEPERKRKTMVMAENVTQSNDQSFFANIFGSLLSCSSVEKCVPAVCCSVKKEEIEQQKIEYKVTSTKKPPRDKADKHEALNMCKIILTGPGKQASHSNPQVPSWAREPDPIPGWTLEEQRALISATKELQKERQRIQEYYPTEEQAQWEYLRLIARRVPGKSADDCKQCLKHFQKEHIAFFGSPSRTSTPSQITRSSSPDQATSKISRIDNLPERHRPSLDVQSRAVFTRTSTI
jgi:hypothetical protein